MKTRSTVLAERVARKSKRNLKKAKLFVGLGVAGRRVLKQILEVCDVKWIEAVIK